MLGISPILENGNCPRGLRAQLAKAEPYMDIAFDKRVPACPSGPIGLELEAVLIYQVLFLLAVHVLLSAKNQETGTD